MPAKSQSDSSAFKHWYDAARYRQLADETSLLSPAFDRGRFLDLTLDGLEERELMDRVRQAAIAFDASLKGHYRDRIAILRQLAPKIGHGFVSISLCDFVARYGLDDPAHSLDALKFLTRFGSAEFAVRPFLQRDLRGTLAVMELWAQEDDEHVRRLASEGSRPRLPWGLRLTDLVRDPQPTGKILETLKQDPALYVRKSVANHLNDIAKDHPDAVIARVSGWDRSHPGTAWIVRHAIRTLVKRGDSRALTLIGASRKTAIVVKHFQATPARVRLGGTLALEVVLQSTAKREQTLVVDFVVHYVKAGGGTSGKVFKWRHLSLNPGESVTLAKRQQIRDFTTRKHYPGKHKIELQVNGQRPAATEFVLSR